MRLTREAFELWETSPTTWIVLKNKGTSSFEIHKQDDGTFRVIENSLSLGRFVLSAGHTSWEFAVEYLEREVFKI